MKGIFNYTSIETLHGTDNHGNPATQVVTHTLWVKIAIHCAVALILLIVALNSYTTVPAGHVKVKTLFGKVDHQELSEGFHLANPLADFTEYDTRNITYAVNKIMVPSQDKLKTRMDVSIIFTVDGALASNMKSEVGTVDDFIAKFLKPKARSIIREVGKGVAKSQDFFLDDVQQDMQDRTLSGLNEFLSDRGVTVHNVLFRDVTLPIVVSNAIIQTKQRQEEVQQEKAKLQVVEQQAQQQVKQAEAAELAAKSTANARRTLADAAAYEIRVLAENQAEANNMINKTLTKDLIENNRVNQWDGAYPTTMVGDGQSLILGLK